MVVFPLTTSVGAVPPLEVGVAGGRAVTKPSLLGIRLAEFLLSLRGLRRLVSLLGKTRTATRMFIATRAVALRSRTTEGLEDFSLASPRPRFGWPRPSGANRSQF